MYYEDLMENVVNNESSFDLHGRHNDIDKPSTKYYEKYSILFNDFWTDNKFHKYITIENHGTGGHGSRIRNAVTGTYYNAFVGSIEEDLYFKVIDSSGRKGRNYPLMLYYDSPQQYENHHFTKVSEATRQRWIEKSLDAQLRLN